MNEAGAPCSSPKTYLVRASKSTLPLFGAVPLHRVGIVRHPRAALPPVRRNLSGVACVPLSCLAHRSPQEEAWALEDLQTIYTALEEAGLEGQDRVDCDSLGAATTRRMSPENCLREVLLELLPLSAAFLAVQLEGPTFFLI